MEKVNRIIKLVLPVLILTEFVLVYSGVTDLGDAFLVIVGVEALLFLCGMTMFAIAVRNYRKGRSRGLDAWTAVEDGLATMLPRRVARLVVLEPRLLVCLVRWLFRRTKPKEYEFAYQQGSMLKPFAMLAVLASPADLLLVHVLAHAFSPWGWLKWVLLAVGIYGVFWMVGLYASLPASPHRLEEKGLQLRYGTHVGCFIPYDRIDTVEREGRKSPGGRDGLQHVEEYDEVHIAVGGITNLTLRLGTPVEVQGFLKKVGPARTIRLKTDDPKGLETSLKVCLENVSSSVASASSVAG